MVTTGLQQGVGNDNLFISVFQQHVKDIFVQDWHSRLENSSRAVFYITFCNFEFQPYLKHVNIKCYRNAITRLRLASHGLNIEAGRWNRTAAIGT